MKTFLPRTKLHLSVLILPLFICSCLGKTQNHKKNRSPYQSKTKEQKTMITLPKLPYAKNALEPHISEETLEYHYGKHHAGYVANINKLIEGTEFADKTLEEIILQTKNKTMYNNAAQVFNHTFYWNCMTPQEQGGPTGQLKTLIEKHWGSFDKFKEQFLQAAATLFGAGWTWLILTKDGKLAIKTTKDAVCPIDNGQTPLLTCDVWEHAYYIDYRNGRKNYLASWWKLINWDFVASNLK